MKDMKAWLAWLDLKGYMWQREQWYAPCTDGSEAIAELPVTVFSDRDVTIQCNESEDVVDVRGMGNQLDISSVAVTSIPSGWTVFATMSGKVVSRPPLGTSGTFTVGVSVYDIWGEQRTANINYTIEECMDDDIPGGIIPVPEIEGEII